MILTQYPSITSSEFNEACAGLEITASDRLDGTDWVSLKWTGEELRIKQQRRVKKRESKEQRGGAEVNEQTQEALKGIIEDDDVEDIASCSKGTATSTEPRPTAMEVDFSITLSPTYSVPVLWVTSSATGSIGQIHDLLLPSHLDAAICSVGVMGGISRAYHPISDLPAFFVHPCNTHEALLAVNDGDALSAEEYLSLWLGLIGSSVGLHMPSKLVGTK